MQHQSECKRNLTAQEISDIVNSISANRSIPDCISNSHISNIRERVREQLSKVSVYPSVLPALKAKIIGRYEQAKMNPGESVGIVTAQSIGERQTQMTLDTFHSAGAALKTVITGVPRFSELLSATKNPKSTTATVYPNVEYSTIGSIRDSLGSKLQGVRICDVVLSMDTGTDKPEWYTAFEMIHGTEHTKFETYVSATFDTSKLYSHRLDLSDIALRVSVEYTDLVCVYSPTFLGRIDIYVDTSNIDTVSINKYLDTVLKPNLKNLIVSGIDGITDVYYEKNDNGSWYIETAGSDLNALLNYPGIDKTRTVSNNVWEIVNTFGIEAARDFLINEFRDTISSDGTYVNKCHITLLVDTMTHGGTIMSVSRYGQRTSTCGPLAKASFEESMDNFVSAAVHGEVESTRSVSAAVMIGKLPGCGTGGFDIHVDMSMLGTDDAASNEQVFVDDTIYEL